VSWPARCPSTTPTNNNGALKDAQDLFSGTAELAEIDVEPIDEGRSATVCQFSHNPGNGCGALVVACIGALVSELSGLAGVGLLFGVPAWITMTAVVGGLIAIVWTASYHSVERTAIVFGSWRFCGLRGAPTPMARRCSPA
jgi:hypothetical protein